MAGQRNVGADQHQQCQKAEGIIEQLGGGDILTGLKAETFQPAKEQLLQAGCVKAGEMYALLAGVVIQIAQHPHIQQPATHGGRRGTEGADQKPPFRHGQTGQSGAGLGAGIDQAEEKDRQDKGQVEGEHLAQSVHADHKGEKDLKDQQHNAGAAAVAAYEVQKQPQAQKTGKQMGRVADGQQRDAEIDLRHGHDQQRADGREEMPDAGLAAEIPAGPQHGQQNDGGADGAHLKPVIREKEKRRKNQMVVKDAQLGGIKPVGGQQGVFLAQHIPQEQVAAHIGIQQIVHPSLNDLPGAGAGKQQAGPGKHKPERMPALLPGKGASEQRGRGQAAGQQGVHRILLFSIPASESCGRKNVLHRK